MSDSSAIAMKSAARLMAAQAVYQSFSDDKDIRLIAEEYLHYRTGMEVEGQKLVEPDCALFSQIVQGVAERRADLDTLIAANRGGEGKPNFEKLIQAILLCGAWELMENRESDAPVIINDYIDVAHAFYEAPIPGLVNAILDSIAKTIR